MPTLADFWKKIQKEGPSHVLLDKTGKTEMTQMAVQKNPDLQWDAIYIRADGWSLGCDIYLTQYAEHLHPWIGVVMRGAKNPKPLTPTSVTITT